MDPRLEKIFKLPLYQRILILVGLMLVIAGLFVYLMYLPLREELASLRQKDATLQNKIQEDQRIADNLPKFKAEFEKMEALLNDALTELPNEKEIPNLLTSITALANLKNKIFDLVYGIIFIIMFALSYYGQQLTKGYVSYIGLSWQTGLVVVLIAGTLVWTLLEKKYGR